MEQQRKLTSDELDKLVAMHQQLIARGLLKGAISLAEASAWTFDARTFFLQAVLYYEEQMQEPEGTKDLQGAYQRFTDLSHMECSVTLAFYAQYYAFFTLKEMSLGEDDNLSLHYGNAMQAAANIPGTGHLEFLHQLEDTFGDLVTSI